MGRGRHNEHVDPHVAAAWDEAPELHQPPPRTGVVGLVGLVGFDVRG